MDIDIDPDQLTILVLYSLPATFEKFQCAIESRDELPTPNALHAKIIEENNTTSYNACSATSDALFAVKKYDFSKKANSTAKQ